jgi:peroxiredoxin
LRERLPDLRAAGLGVLAVFCQSRPAVAAWLERHPVPFPVLVDDDRSRAKAWGVYQRLSYDALNIARPASFVVGTDHRVLYARISRHQADHAPIEEIVEAAGF